MKGIFIVMRTISTFMTKARYYKLSNKLHDILDNNNIKT